MIEHARESEAEVQTSARNKIEKIASYALTVNTPIKFLCYNVPCQRTVNCKNCKIQKKESINERKRHRKKFRWRFVVFDHESDDNDSDYDDDSDS